MNLMIITLFNYKLMIINFLHFQTAVMLSNELIFITLNYNHFLYNRISLDYKVFKYLFKSLNFMSLS
jgi:hypothetical protein